MTFTTSDGLNLHYTDTGGDGLPLLCLPGLTRTGADFNYLAPHLENVRLITMDMRGRGASDWDQNWQNYSLPVECRDIVALLDHLKLDRVALLGTSRGGLQAMGLAATHKDRLIGVALNDIGPELDPEGLNFIMAYLGHNPKAKTHEAAAQIMATRLPGFANVPDNRWLDEARLHYRDTGDSLEITYDPALRKAAEAAGDALPDLWPFFDALESLPLCAIRGAGSNLLTAETFAKMQARHPDMIAAEVPDRGHVPFLDEPEAIAALKTWQEHLA